MEDHGGSWRKQTRTGRDPDEEGAAGEEEREGREEEPFLIAEDQTWRWQRGRRFFGCNEERWDEKWIDAEDGQKWKRSERRRSVLERSKVLRVSVKHQLFPSFLLLLHPMSFKSLQTW